MRKDVTSVSEKNIDGSVFTGAEGYFLMPRCVYDVLSYANETELRVAVYMSANPNSDIKTAAEAIGVTEADVLEALAFFRGASKTKKTKKAVVSEEKTARLGTPPDYSGSQLAEITKRSAELSPILNECQQLLGKTFTSHDTEVYIGVLFDFLGLSPEYILMLTSYCCGLGKKNVRYVEKTAFSLTEQGVDSCERLERYIADSEKKNKLEYKLRKLFGFGERALTATEKKHFAKFFELPFDMVEYAYEQMIKNIGEVKLGYMSKIIDSWREKGIKTKAQAMAQKAPQKKSGNAGFENESFDFDDFLSVAIKNGTKKK